MSASAASHHRAREATVDLAKHDMAITYGGRTFAVRAYLDGSSPDGPGWHAVVLENRTPLGHGRGASPDAAGCFAEAVRFLAAAVDALPAAQEVAT